MFFCCKTILFHLLLCVYPVGNMPTWMGWRYNTYWKKAREKNGRVTKIKWRWKKEKGKERRAYGGGNTTPATQCQEQTELLLLTQIPKHQPSGTSELAEVTCLKTQIPRPCPRPTYWFTVSGGGAQESVFLVISPGNSGVHPAGSGTTGKP